MEQVNKADAQVVVAWLEEWIGQWCGGFSKFIGSCNAYMAELQGAL